jgi:sugar phosphate isomerase/epimerase
MKLSFATLGCPAWNLEQIAERAHAMGFDGVELRGVAGEHLGPDETPNERRRIRELFASNGIAIAAIMGYSRFTMTDPRQRADNQAVFAKFIETARDIGCPTIRFFGGAQEGTDREANIRRVAESLKPLAEQAARAGVRLALETHDDWCRGANVRAVLDSVANPALGVCWDVANSFFVEPPAATYNAIKDRICHVHFKDARQNADGQGHHSCLPGNGEVDLRQALRLLHAGNYRGYLSFEWEKKWEPQLEEPEKAFPYYIRYTTALMHELGIPPD